MQQSEKSNKTCIDITLDSLKVWHHQVSLKMTLLNHKMTKNLHILDYFPEKLLFFLKNNIISLENLQKLDYIITCIDWDSYILKKKIEFLAHLSIRLTGEPIV